MIGPGNMVFREPDIDIRTKNGKATVELKGLGVYDPTTGQLSFRNSSTDDIARSPPRQKATQHQGPGIHRRSRH